MSERPRLAALYVGPFNEGGTCLDRLRVLEDLGVRIIPFDTRAFDSSFRLMRSLSHRLAWGPPVARLNRGLVERARTLERDISFVLVDKGVWVRPESLLELRERTGARLVHFTPDPALLFHRSRHFVGSIPVYDLLVTTKPWEIELYRQHGARRVFLTHQAYDRSRFFPVPPDPSLACDVVFVGHYEPAYAGKLRAATRAASSVKIWGKRWGWYAALHRWAASSVQGEGIWSADYTRALCSASICLGLLSKMVPETSTTRTFEIPACGAFLLAERTDEHQSFFEEGREAEYFGSEEELQDKIRFYIAHADARRRIAAAGRERCLRGGYSNHDRLRAMLREIESLPAFGGGS